MENNGAYAIFPDDDNGAASTLPPNQLSDLYKHFRNSEKPKRKKKKKGKKKLEKALANFLASGKKKKKSKSKKGKKGKSKKSMSKERAVYELKHRMIEKTHNTVLDIVSHGAKRYFDHKLPVR